MFKKYHLTDVAFNMCRHCNVTREIVCYLRTILFQSSCILYLLLLFVSQRDQLPSKEDLEGR